MEAGEEAGGSVRLKTVGLLRYLPMHGVLIVLIDKMRKCATCVTDSSKKSFQLDGHVEHGSRRQPHVAGSAKRRCCFEYRNHY